MVFDTNPEKKTGEKKPRIKVEGKLIGISADSSQMDEFDPKAGKFSWLRLSIVTGQDTQGNPTYKNVTAYKTNFEKMPELKKADDYLKQKIKPIIELECYEVEKPAIDKETSKPIMEETTEVRNGKEVIVERQKVWKNYRMSRDDVINSFSIKDIDESDAVEENKTPDIQ